MSGYAWHQRENGKWEWVRVENPRVQPPDLDSPEFDPLRRVREAKERAEYLQTRIEMMEQTLTQAKMELHLCRAVSITFDEQDVQAKPVIGAAVSGY